MSVLIRLTRLLRFADPVFLVVADWMFAVWNSRIIGCSLAESVAYVGFNTSGSFCEDILDCDMDYIRAENW